MYRLFAILLFVFPVPAAIVILEQHYEIALSFTGGGTVTNHDGSNSIEIGPLSYSSNKASDSLEPAGITELIQDDITRDDIELAPGFPFNLHFYSRGTIGTSFSTSPISIMVTADTLSGTNGCCIVASNSATVDYRVRFILTQAQEFTINGSVGAEAGTASVAIGAMDGSYGNSASTDTGDFFFTDRRILRAGIYEIGARAFGISLLNSETANSGSGGTSTIFLTPGALIPVPEPATFLLIGGALLSLSALRMRQN